LVFLEEQGEVVERDEAGEVVVALDQRLPEFW
jgi:hypothetical protein